MFRRLWALLVILGLTVAMVLILSTSCLVRGVIGVAAKRTVQAVSL